MSILHNDIEAAKGIKTDIRRTGTAARNERTEEEMRRIFETYLSLYPFINNWDLVNLSAYKIAVRHAQLHHRAHAAAATPLLAATQADEIEND